MLLASFMERGAGIDRNKSFFFSYRADTGQEMARGENIERLGQVWEFYFESWEIMLTFLRGKVRKN